MTHARQSLTKWDRIALVTGLAGFVLELLAFVLPVFQGNKANTVALGVLGVIGILLWAAWVSWSLFHLNSERILRDRPAAVQIEGFRVHRDYFDAIDRSFLNELRMGHGDDSKGTEWEKKALATAVQDGSQVRIQRLHPRFRWIMSVKKYQNTGSATEDKFIPAELDHSDQLRFIYCEFRARVVGDPQQIAIRLRNPDGTWMKRADTNGNVARKAQITRRDWEVGGGVLGPVRANEPCYLSLEIDPGPSGEQHCLYLRDLRILELRKEEDLRGQGNIR